MTEIAQTGVTAPAAGGQTGTIGQGQVTQPTGQPAGSPTGPATATPAGQPASAAAPIKEVAVPLHVVEAIRNELSDSKKTAGELRGQLEQIKALQQMGGFNAPSQQVQPTAPAQSAQPEFKDPFEGVSDGELVTVADVRKMVKTLQAAPQTDGTKQTIANLTQALNKIQLQVQDPQYETTIRTYLPEMITANPGLRELIQRTPNPVMAALAIAKLSPKYQATLNKSAEPTSQNPTQPPDILSDLQRIIENAARPGTPASAGGMGAVTGFDRFKTMNDKDLDAEVNRVLSGQAR